MSVLAQKTLLTAEDFSRLPQPEDGSQQQLVDGMIRTMPPPSFLHGVVCNRLGRKLGNFVDEHNLGLVTNNDSGVIVKRDPDTVRGPDVAYWSRERLPSPPAEGYPQVPPDLLVDVLSPTDLFSQVLRKVQQYLQAGVAVVWVVVPEDHSVTVYRPGKEAEIMGEEDTLTAGDVLPGFNCPVRQLFP